jgi:hypothetical protein
MINGNCTDINCPERRSVCCDAPCERIIVKGKLKFVCSVCFELFVGGECNAIEEYNKGRKDVFKQIIKALPETKEIVVKLMERGLRNL